MPSTESRVLHAHSHCNIVGGRELSLVYRDVGIFICGVAHAKSERPLHVDVGCVIISARHCFYCLARLMVIGCKSVNPFRIGVGKLCTEVTLSGKEQCQSVAAIIAGRSTLTTAEARGSISLTMRGRPSLSTSTIGFPVAANAFTSAVWLAESVRSLVLRGSRNKSFRPHKPQSHPRRGRQPLLSLFLHSAHAPTVRSLPHNPCPAQELHWRCHIHC